MSGKHHFLCPVQLHNVNFVNWLHDMMTLSFHDMTLVGRHSLRLSLSHSFAELFCFEAGSWAADLVLLACGRQLNYTECMLWVYINSGICLMLLNPFLIILIQIGHVSTDSLVCYWKWVCVYCFFVMLIKSGCVDRIWEIYVYPWNRSGHPDLEVSCTQLWSWLNLLLFWLGATAKDSTLECFCSVTSYKLLHGWDQVQFKSLKVRNYTQNAYQHHFHCFLKAIRVLKSSCCLKSPTHAIITFHFCQICFISCLA